jgi:anti-sigma regulatory factor (Ser/Thr protein kinase)
MTDLDTRKAGSGQTVSFVNVRLESETLLPEQLIARIKAVHDTDDVDVLIKDQGTGASAVTRRPQRAASR